MKGSEISPEVVTSNINEGQRAGSFLLHVVRADLDVNALVADYHSIMQNHAVRATARADGSTLRSISLTHRPDAIDPLYDGNNTQFGPGNEKIFLEEDFTEFNDNFKDTAFYDLYKRMPFKIGRMRLNLLPELTVFSMHRDSAPRAHIALITNPNCYLVSGDDIQIHHIPADGNVHIYDTTLPHTAFNSSRLNRVHLTMSLADHEK